MLLGARVDDQVAVANRFVVDGELKDAVKHEPPAARRAAVEAEHELVQVSLQVRLVDRALVGAEQPPFGQRGDPVDAGQEAMRVAASQTHSPLAATLPDIAEPFDPGVAVPTSLSGP